MASLIDPHTIDTLSVNGRKLKGLSPELITDVVHIIKQAEIRSWNPLRVFFELRKSLFFFREREKSKGRHILIMDITFNKEDELVHFQVFVGTPSLLKISLTINDIRRLQLMMPIPG